MENAPPDCRTVVERLFQFLDGELDTSSCAEIERHLELCGSCLGHADFERDLRLLIRRRCGSDLAPEGLRDRLRAALRASLDSLE